MVSYWVRGHIGTHWLWLRIYGRTPIVNGLVDAYPLFRFIRLRPWYDWEDFNSHISRIERKNRKLYFSVQSIYLTCHFSFIGEHKVVSYIQVDSSSSKEGFPTGWQEAYRTSAEDCYVTEIVIFGRRKRNLPNGETFPKQRAHLVDSAQVEARSQAKFNRFLRAGTVLK